LAAAADGPLPELNDVTVMGVVIIFVHAVSVVPACAEVDSQNRVANAAIDRNGFTACSFVAMSSTGWRTTLEQLLSMVSTTIGQAYGRAPSVATRHPKMLDAIGIASLGLHRMKR
jgi:hypothetical protein